MKKLIYISIVSLLLATFVIIVVPLGLTDKQIDNLVKIVPAFFAAAGLIVTLSLYDRFGLKKFIYEKQLKAVLDLLEAYKKLDIHLYFSYGAVQIPFHYQLNLTLNKSNRAVLKIIAPDKMKHTVLMTGDSAAVIEDLNLFLRSPYLPPQLINLEHFTFLKMDKAIFESDKQVVISYSGRKNLEDLDVQTDLYHFRGFKYANGITLERFIEFHENVLTEIKLWVNRETNLKNLNY